MADTEAHNKHLSDLNSYMSYQITTLNRVADQAFEQRDETLLPIIITAQINIIRSLCKKLAILTGINDLRNHSANGANRTATWTTDLMASVADRLDMHRPVIKTVIESSVRSIESDYWRQYIQSEASILLYRMFRNVEEKIMRWEAGREAPEQSSLAKALKWTKLDVWKMLQPEAED